MADQSYAALVLGASAEFSQQAQDLQKDLRTLGYFAGPIDGVFGHGTATAVLALTYDLQHNDGSSTSSDGSAPVAVSSYNQGSLTGQADQAFAACIGAMLDDPNFPKIPNSTDPVGDNQKALAAVKGMANLQVPLPFLLAILQQESGLHHYQAPARGNIDNFVTIGLDRNDQANSARITSRGYGVGQYTLFHHPPTAGTENAEIESFILDPVKNVSKTVSEMLGKFNNWVAGPTDKADDRIAEIGSGPLVMCKYPQGDARYLTDCVSCANNAPKVTITSGVTPYYDGAQGTYAQTQYHVGSYSNVPQRDKIGCDWPYAVRRFNGSGVNSFDYQAEFLLKLQAQG